MYLQLYRADGGLENQRYALSPANRYLEAHPFDLASLMDEVWGIRDQGSATPPPAGLFPETQPISALPFYETPPGSFPLNNLIYAYMIENTRIYEIFEKVIFEYFHGEKLGFPAQPGTYRWLRSAEELFYKNSSNYLIQSFISNIRADIRASRRNAYHRMFGMDLNHGTGGSANYPYHKAGDANKEFVPLFEELLSEIWVGITYSGSPLAGPNLTDESKMNDLIVRIREMMTTRKQAGNLFREEFFYVATLSWMHLTLFVDDAPVVRDMAINAESPAERLRQMGERVGYPAHPKADAFFKIAEDISVILTNIERIANLNCQVFFAPAAAVGVLRGSAENVITQWSIATGKDIKAMKVRPSTIGAAAR